MIVFARHIDVAEISVGRQSYFFLNVFLKNNNKVK